MIDTHAHIDDEQYIEEFDSYIANQIADGVEMMLVPGINSSSIQSVAAICNQYPTILFPAIGLHPEEVNNQWQEELVIIHKALAERICPWIAIGEIGLDYHFSVEYKEEQKEVFRTQLRWALKYDLPVMIHARDATEDTIQIIREINAEENGLLRGVFHCFSGSHETAEILINMGFYLGIGGVITFKNCKLSENLKGIPLERILLETDSPYMSPVPFRGQRNESRYMHYVSQRLSEIYGLSAKEIEEITSVNARELFGLPNNQKNA